MSARSALNAAIDAVGAEMGALREAAEQRLGVEPGAIEAINDPTYDAALRAWSTWRHATDVLISTLASGGGS